MSDYKTFIISGASGMVGSGLVAYLRAQGHQVRTLTRRAVEHADEYHWDPYADIIDPDVFTDADVLIHLSGENVAVGRWSKKIRERIMRSRVQTTRCLAAAMEKTHVQLQCIMVASGVGYYGTVDAEDRIFTEDDKNGQGFLAEVCREWEAEAQKLETYARRFLRLRLGVVLGADGGLIKRLRPIFRCFLGGHLGNGKQYVPWISQADVHAICLYLADHHSMNGAINMVAPQYIDNDQCMRAICKALHRPCFAHIPSFVVKLLFGQMGREVLLSSMRVEPKVLLENTYDFLHADIESCISDIFAND